MASWPVTVFLLIFLPTIGEKIVLSSFPFNIFMLYAIPIFYFNSGWVRIGFSSICIGGKEIKKNMAFFLPKPHFLKIAK
jgi:hypothetical protein